MKVTTALGNAFPFKVTFPETGANLLDPQPGANTMTKLTKPISKRVRMG
jgi:hypothetical protein